ncbi:MAG TPA: isoprenylcysteine carboxylmethyltransferase family protein [Gammaproteobacteria bacterium]|nr:isoprenylcysteine carboxylmethyltransferase family protein [Gammaproteobacteria bacterium]
MKIRIPPPIYALMFGFFMWMFEAIFPLFYWLPYAWRGLAWLPAIVGLIVVAIALVQFMQQKTTPDPFHPERARELVISGLYRYSRNPMYLGMLILLVAWAVYLRNMSSLLLLPIFMWMLTTQQILFEEAALRDKFGNSYEAYLKRVRRWC